MIRDEDASLRMLSVSIGLIRVGRVVCFGIRLDISGTGSWGFGTLLCLERRKTFNAR